MLHQLLCVYSYHMQNYRHLYAIHNLLFSSLFACRCETHIPRKMPETKDFYEFTRCRQQTVSTWHERTESTSFTGRFVRLDPRLLLLSWSYAETYQSIFSTVLIFPFITLGTNFEEISYSISSGTFLKTKAEGKAIAVLCFKYPI